MAVAVAVWLSGMGVAAAANTSAVLTLAVDNAGTAKRLANANVSSDATFMLTGNAVSDVASVSYYLDDPLAKNQADLVSAAPFELPESGLTQGKHSLYAVATTTTGHQYTLFARFGVGTNDTVIAKKATTTTTVAEEPSATEEPSADESPEPATTSGGSGDQTLGVGGVATPSDAVVSSADSKADLNIKESGSEGKPKVYDGGGHTVGTINISGNWITVQNFKIVASGQYGVNSKGTHITIQNNDIKNVHASGDGDLNAITFSGDNHTIAYNTAIDFVTGNPGGSHTDAIQTWVSDSHLASSNVLVKGNKFSGPDKNAGAPIHQCFMAEGLGQGGNHGGSGVSQHWLVSDNYFKDSWNQCLKFDGIKDVSVTRNEFAGNASKIMEVTSASSDVKFYADNKITGSYGSKPETTPGSGPTDLDGSTSTKSTTSKETPANTKGGPESSSKKKDDSSSN